MDERPKMLSKAVRDTIRLKHYSYQTEKSYVQWIKRSVAFHHKQHPREMGQAEIEGQAPPQKFSIPKNQKLL